MKKAKKVTKKSHNLKHGWMAISAGVVLVFLLGVIATLGYQSLTKSTASIQQHSLIEGQDGLMGLVGYSKPFAHGDTVHYAVTYRNDSSVDRYIHIKATQFSRDPSENVRDSQGSLVGRITSARFSDKATVKAGRSHVFMVVVEQTNNPTSQYIELEAFKATKE